METGEPKAFREGSFAAARKGALFQGKCSVPVFIFHEPQVEILNARGWGRPNWARVSLTGPSCGESMMLEDFTVRRLVGKLDKDVQKAFPGKLISHLLNSLSEHCRSILWILFKFFLTRSLCEVLLSLSYK